MVDRVGQPVRPNESYFYRPICKVVSSEVKPCNMVGSGFDTLHVVEYPTGAAVYVWEHEWPGRFGEVKDG